MLWSLRAGESRNRRIHEGCASRAGLVLDPAGAQPHHAVAAPRQRGVVRHQHQRGAALGVAGEQQVDDLASRGLVEIAGRLVGDEDRRIGRQRARERDALLLAAGQLRRDNGRAVRRGRRRPARARRGSWASCDAGQLERHRDVLERRHGRDEMEGLEDDADIAAAEARQRVLAERAERLARRRRPSRCRRAPARP